ncbi:MAG TPA: hypothetical protein VOA87_16490 [Thermoanaerobaculia bacterium]|nr:hypothetical protein [Thermoanaerobaculia bacterium]
MTDQNLDRIRYVTSHFHHLQGLRWKVPLGLYLIQCPWDGSLSIWGVSIWDSKWFGSFVYWAFCLSPVILAIASPLYYRRRFGLVYRKAKAARYLRFLIGTLVVALTALDFFNEFLFVRLVYLSVGGAFLGTWLRRGRPRLQEHYAVLGALLLGASMLDRDRYGMNFFWIVGTALILAGLLDHWQLLRTLKRPIDEPQTIAPAPMEKLR